MSSNGTQKRPIIINLFPAKVTSEVEAQLQNVTQSSNFQEQNYYSQSNNLDFNENDCTRFRKASKFSLVSDDSDSDRERSGIKRKFVKSWETLYPFIEYDEEKNIMFCKVCKQFSDRRQKGIRFVIGTSNFRASSIQYHKKSVLHARCQKRANAVLNGNSNSLELLDSDRRKLIEVLKLVYFMIQTKSPFTYFPHLCETQKKEGIDVGPAYTSHQKVVPFFAKYISVDLENKLSEELSGSKLFSVILDNSFSRAAESHELVYIKYFDDTKLKTVFLGVIDSTDKRFSSVYGNLCKLFERFKIVNWIQNIVSITIDSSPNSLSWHDELVKEVKEKSKHFICSYNFQLHKIKCCSKIFLDCSFISNFCTLIYEIFWYYESLPDDGKHLPHIGKELEVIKQEYGKLPKNTSACFSFSALAAVNKDWILLVQFLKDRNDSILYSKTRKIGVKILLLITRSNFLWKLAVILDILTCLGSFSNKVRDSGNLPFAFRQELQNVCSDIQKAVEGKGAVVQSVVHELSERSSFFRKISIHLDISLNKVTSGLQDLANLLVNHLRKNILDTDFFDSCHIFDTRTWPRLEHLTRFGNSDYSKLYLTVEKSEENLQASLSEWETLKENASQYFPPDLLLKPRLSVSKMVNEFAAELPIVTTVLKKLLLLDFSCDTIERGYREMNLIKSSDRCMLSVPSLQNSMIIIMHGPTLAQFNPIPSIELWMKECARRYHKRSKHKNNNGILMTNCDTFLECFNKCSNLNPILE